jgi:hypothetical protein
MAASGRIDTVAALWAAYYADVTQEDAYWQHRHRAEACGELYAAAMKIPRHPETEEGCTFQRTRDREHPSDPVDCVKLRNEYAEAWAAWHRKRGVPEQWIGYGMDVTAPLDVCQSCWQPNADTVERRTARRFGYHAECLTTMSIRCDLRCAAWARINNNEERAVMWERRALMTHNEEAPARPPRQHSP